MFLFVVMLRFRFSYNVLIDTFRDNQPKSTHKDSPSDTFVTHKSKNIIVQMDVDSTWL